MSVKSYYECPENGTIFNFDNIIYIKPFLKEEPEYVVVCYAEGCGPIHKLTEEGIDHNKTHRVSTNPDIITSFKDYKESKDKCPICLSRNKKLENLL